MPFHGDHKRIHLHGQLAEAVGRRPPTNIFKGENGLPLEIDGRRRALRRARACRDDLRRRRRHRRRRPTSRCATAGCSAPTASSSSSRRSPSRTARRSPTRRSSSAACPSATTPTSCSTRSARRSTTRSSARRRGRDPRDRPAPADPARRPRGVRLRAAEAAADGAAGRCRGLTPHRGWRALPASGWGSDFHWENRRRAALLPGRWAPELPGRARPRGRGW